MERANSLDPFYHLSHVPWWAAAGYLGGVYAVHRAKRSSPPTALPKPALALYNAAQVAVNAYVAWEIASALGGRVWGIGIADTPRVRHGVFLHYLCKYLDFADTLVIVLRKKAAQLSFLHLYHHASIVLVWGWVVATWPSGADGGSACYAYGAFVNAVVHVVMYAYYGCTVVELRPPLWLKRSVTGVQLTQFATCVVHAVAALALDRARVHGTVQVLYHIAMLRLFLPLLLGAKKRDRRADDAPAHLAVERTPSEAEVKRD